MKSTLKNLLVWLSLSIIMMILLIFGMAIGMAIFPSEAMNKAAEAEGSLPLLFLTCFLNTGAILYFIKHATVKGWKMVTILFVVSWGLMYFMSQIETLWFNESVQFPIMGILGIVTGGAITFFFFSILATWMTGKFKSHSYNPIANEPTEFIPLLKGIALIAIVIWPLLYFSAGYFIAWQFDAIRLYYTGSTDKASYFFMIADYFSSNLYFFQIFRGILWTLLAMLVIQNTTGSIVRKGIIVTLLFVFLACIQLLLPNPFMPEAVRLGHLLETCTENAILAIIIVWVLEGSLFTKSNPKVALAA